MEKSIKSRSPVLVLFWSFGLFILAYTTQYLYMVALSSFGGVSMKTLLKGGFVTPQTLLAQGVISMVLGIPLIFVIVKYLWLRDRTWMGARFSFKYLSYGLLLGLLLPLFILLIISLFGKVNILGGPGRFTLMELAFILLGNLFYITFKGILEEYVFRGMALREWAARWGWLIASILGGLYFGVAHMLAAMPHVSFGYFVVTILLIAVASLLFAAMYIRFKTLWLPIGFHIGWNFCLKAILGTILSGNDNTFGLYETLISGPAVVTGGDFGMELSLVTLAVYSILAVLFLTVPKKGKPTLWDAKTPAG